MKCEDMDWVGYEAHALDPEINKKMDDHLAECTKCQKEWSEQNKTNEMSRGLGLEIESECFEPQN